MASITETRTKKFDEKSGEQDITALRYKQKIMVNGIEVTVATGLRFPTVILPEMQDKVLKKIRGLYKDLGAIDQVEIDFERLRGDCDSVTLSGGGKSVTLTGEERLLQEDELVDEETGEVIDETALEKIGKNITSPLAIFLFDKLSHEFKAKPKLLTQYLTYGVSDSELKELIDERIGNDTGIFECKNRKMEWEMKVGQTTKLWFDSKRPALSGYKLVAFVRNLFNLPQYV